MTTVYDACVASIGNENNVTRLMQCISNSLEMSRRDSDNNSTDVMTDAASNMAGGSDGVSAADLEMYVKEVDIKSWLLLLTGAMVFFMQVKIFRLWQQLLDASGITVLSPFMSRCECCGGNILYRLALPWCVRVRFVKRT
jgi:hypothetical protein